MSAAAQQAAHELLDTAYRDLGLTLGDLVPTSDSPTDSLSADQWRDKGEWLMLGKRMGAERVFFVGDDPVILFTALTTPTDETAMVSAYRRAWSMGRARCLFIAVEGELRVYALNEPPPRTLAEQESLTPLKIVSRTADVAEVLADYHRDRLQSGITFEEPEYRRQDGRADQRLLQDVFAATEALEAAGLPRTAAHALIERVILVRYLEDREVIGPKYFGQVAEPSRRWQRALNQESQMPSLGARSTFVSCLSDYEFTYAIFTKLAETFNGDMFLVDESEAQNVTAEHLTLVQRMLTGAGLTGQQTLFLWAYDFSVVPTSLISSMYEQFYRAGTDDDSGTHYTPQQLAEYVVAQTLTPEVLATNPRLCDPACGSGVFLVEAFRRMVRHHMTATPRVSAADLQALLRERLAGIDTNPEAIRLAAFSLYLAYLNYQDPPDIFAAGPLPRLIYRASEEPHNPVLVVADAFSPYLPDTLEFPGLALSANDDRQLPQATILPWSEGSFDVVIGNPPWDEPRRTPPTVAERWARSADLAVGDRSKSQLFMWRALTMVKPTGIVALLVAATPFHNVRSKKFRAQWLSSVILTSFVDFTSARRMFFPSGSAPFALVTFRRRLGQQSERFIYRSVRPSEVLDATRSMAFARSEHRWVEQRALSSRDYLWKTYAWGSHRDAALMAHLDAEQQLGEIVSTNPRPAWGYQWGRNQQRQASDYLKSIPSLNTFEIWGAINSEWFEDPPEYVKRSPDERLYSGQRVLITEGIRAGFGPNARLVSDHYSFRHKIYCVPLKHLPEWQAKTVLAIILSSLGRYRLFMRSGSWGLWHDKVNAEDIMALPVRFADGTADTTTRICDAIDALKYVDPRPASLLGEELPADRYSIAFGALMNEINEAVFDLFDLSSAERDLVNDFHTYTLGMASDWRTSPGLESLQLPIVASGTAHDVRQIDQHPIREYLDIFLSEWNPLIQPDGEFGWQIIRAPSGGLLCALFETREPAAGPSPELNVADWHTVLDRLEKSLSYPSTQAVGNDNVVRSVSDTSIVVVKRHEARLWSASAAREDAEATMLQAMRLQEAW
jgi:hypothetical protein